MKTTVIALSLLAVLVVGCNRPPELKPGDMFCINQIGLGAEKFFVARSVKYPWVEANPQKCKIGSPTDMTFWINLESVGSFSPNCVCREQG